MLPSPVKSSPMVAAVVVSGQVKDEITMSLQSPAQTKGLNAGGLGSGIQAEAGRAKHGKFSAFGTSPLSLHAGRQSSNTVTRNDSTSRGLSKLSEVLVFPNVISMCCGGQGAALADEAPSRGWAASYSTPPSCAFIPESFLHVRSST